MSTWCAAGVFDRRSAVLGAAAPILAASLSGCGGGTPPDDWAGSVDTLASGQVVVHNPAEPIWAEGGEWRLTEDLRIGSLDDDGPALFGVIYSLAVDGAGRIYVLEGQSQEVRVFGPDGAHVRTLGRKGGGPGELARAVHIAFGPDGGLWVADPQNNRISVFDTAGAYVESHPVPGGFMILPWPGRFDREGNYYYPIPRITDGEFGLALAKYDAALEPLDTLGIPDDPVGREFFEIRSSNGGVARASVPFSPGFRWSLSRVGTFWGLLTGEYRLFELSQAGDTLRTLTREFDPAPVTEADLAEARENLEWFTEQGGHVDWSKIPARKPAARAMVVDPADHLWVWAITEDAPDGVALDVFDPAGRYLGRVTSPVPLLDSPDPVFQGGAVYAVTRSELDVPYVVRLRIERPEPVGG